MVRGLDVFRDHFVDHSSQYALIGGTACYLAFSSKGLEFRATKDLDIVLIVDALDADFGRVFWDFVRKGGYQNKGSSGGGEVQFYRFSNPSDESYPAMLELFSREPDFEIPLESGHLTPIPLGEVSSLSAILLNNDYYELIQKGNLVEQEISFISPETLIPLKAIAWLDLTRQKSAGERVDSKNIKKHKNDVFRLFSLLSPDSEVTIPASVRADFKEFLDRMTEQPPDLKSLKIPFKPEEVIEILRKIYLEL